MRGSGERAGVARHRAHRFAFSHAGRPTSLRPQRRHTPPTSLRRRRDPPARRAAASSLFRYGIDQPATPRGRPRRRSSSQTSGRCTKCFDEIFPRCAIGRQKRVARGKKRLPLKRRRLRCGWCVCDAWATTILRVWPESAVLVKAGPTGLRFTAKKVSSAFQPTRKCSRPPWHRPATSPSPSS